MGDAVLSDFQLHTNTMKYALHGIQFQFVEEHDKSSVTLFFISVRTSARLLLYTLPVGTEIHAPFIRDQGNFIHVELLDMILYLAPNGCRVLRPSLA